MKNTKQARELIRRTERDQSTLAELFKQGEIGAHQPYHPKLREIHEANAAALEGMIDENGWPGTSMVGEQAAESAWMIAQHAGTRTNFMMRCADLLEIAVKHNDAQGWQLAFLRDRIATMAGKEQIYGTQFDQDEDGWPIPFPIHGPEGVDERRRKLGLNSLDDRLSEMREREKAQREMIAKRKEPGKSST